MTALSFNEAIKNAKLHARQGNVEEVHALLNKVLVSFAEGTGAHLDTVEKHRYRPDQENPELPQAVNSELVGLYNNEQFFEVLERAEDYLSSYQGSYILWNIIGAAAGRLNQFEKAIIAFRKMIDLVPESPQAYCNLGNALIDNQMARDAVQPLKKALALLPNYPEAHYILGNAYHALGDIEEAIENYDRSLELDPKLYKAHHNKGSSLSHKGETEDAIGAFKAALTLKPNSAETHHLLSCVLMKSGRLEEGLEEYEWRWEMPNSVSDYRNFSQPAWDGITSLQNKSILIWAEQGIGDTINWSSFLPLIESQSKRCILECSAKLVPLLSRSFPGIEVRPEDRSHDADRDDFDLHLPMGSLYRQLLPVITEETQSTAFLTPDFERVNYWKERLRSLGDGPYIGIGWKSAKMSPDRANNYAPLAEWSPLFALPNVTFVNLQYKDFENDLKMIKDEFNVTVHNFEDLDLFNDLDEVAALSQALDIVVTPKIAVTYTSAAVGTDTILVNWRQSDWSHALSNPAGPSVTIFERNTWEPWKPIFQTISNKLGQILHNTNARQ